MEFGPGAAATFLYYFTCAALTVTFVMARSTGLGIETGIPEQFGAVGGLVAGGLGVYFNRTSSFNLPVQGRKTFLNELESTLAQYGYRPVEFEPVEFEPVEFEPAEFEPAKSGQPDSERDPADSLRVYERSGLSKWMSGRIFVQIEGQQATIASRANTVRALKKILT